MIRDTFLGVPARWRAFGADKLLKALAGTFVLLLLVQGPRYGCVRRLEKTVTRSLAPNTEGPTQRVVAVKLEEYVAISRHGILGSVTQPPEKLWGIMGDSALIGASSEKAKLYSVGAKTSAGERVISIAWNEVVLEKDGKERTEYVFTELKTPSSGRERRIEE